MSSNTVEDSAPGGFDNVFLSSAPPRRVIPDFLVALARRWPHLQGSVEEPALDFGGGSLPGAAAFAGTIHSVLLARDEAMLAHADEHGASAMPDGEGPLSLLHEEMADVRWNVELAETETRGGGSALLVFSRIHEYTLVTPGDPAVDPFSRDVCELLAAACLAP